MIPKHIIELAIKGGWKPVENYVDIKIEEDEVKFITQRHDNGFNSVNFVYAEIALDPSFWQALGRAQFNDPNVKILENWKHRAHRFYDLILTNGDTDKFWADLLTK